MFALLALVLPFGLAGAVSPVMLLEQTVLLSGPDGRNVATRFAAGAVLTLLAFVSTLVIFGRTISLPTAPHLSAALDVVIGLLLIVLACYLHSRSTTEAKPPERRELAASQALGFGVFSMATNFTTLALLIPASKIIAASEAELPARLLAGLLIVALGSVPAWLPVALTAVAPGPAERGLTSLGDFIKRRGSQITVLLVGGLGAILAVRGALHLAGL